MEEEYWGHCDICDNETQVMVIDSEDLPCFCPMCGSDLEYSNLNEED